MGADIHPYIEVRCGKQWFYVGEAYSHRNYAFFAALSGVRGDGQNFPNQDDIPDDSSKFVAETWEKWRLDGHSITVVTFEQLKLWKEELEASEAKDEFVTNYISEWLNSCKKLTTLFDEVRVVAWYDN